MAAASPADILFYGGSRGGGKSFLIELEPTRHVGNDGFRAMFFRRTSKDIRKPGGLWDTSRLIYPRLGAVPRDALLEWRFPSGAWFKFNHLEHEKDVDDHQGAQYPYIAFDELTHFSERMFWYLAACNRSTCGVRPYIRGTCNPDPDSWVKSMILWYLDDEGRYAREDRAGVLRYFARVDERFVWGNSPEEVRDQVPHVFEGLSPEEAARVVLSFTFVPSFLDDNPKLVQADPGYRAKLMAMPLVERERFLKGDWLIRETAGTMFREDWFGYVDRPPPTVVRRVRYWDLSGSARRRSDHTAGVLMSIDEQGIAYVEDVVNVQLRPAGTEETIRKTAEADGKNVEIWIEQEQGGAAAILIDTYQRKVLPGFYVQGAVVRGEGTKVERAKPASSASEHGHVKLVRGLWNRPFTGQLQAFPDSSANDMADAFAGAFNKLHEGGELAYASA